MLKFLFVLLSFDYELEQGDECACASEWRSCFSGVFFFFFFFYFIKISKFALPGVMLMYERTSKDRKKERNLML